VKSIASLPEPLQEGEEVCFTDGEVQTIGQVYRRSDGMWEGRGDWKFTDRDKDSIDARRIEQVRVLDWHDGIVLAITRTNWRSETFLASLLSWDHKHQKRVLALIPLTEEQLGRFSPQTDWSDIRGYLDTLRSQLTDEVTVIKVDDLRGVVVVGEATLAARDVGRDLFGDAESALSAERRRWLELPFQ
jgi:hypothetical protein